jgi:hypothetical protein
MEFQSLNLNCVSPLAYLTRVGGFGIALFVTLLLCALIVHYVHHVCEVIDTELVLFDSITSTTLRSDSFQIPLLLSALAHPNPLIKVSFRSTLKTPRRFYSLKKILLGGSIQHTMLL